jgi:hypothetical protein
VNALKERKDSVTAKFVVYGKDGYTPMYLQVKDQKNKKNDHLKRNNGASARCVTRATCPLLPITRSSYRQGLVSGEVETAGVSVLWGCCDPASHLWEGSRFRVSLKS